MVALHTDHVAGVGLFHTRWASTRCLSSKHQLSPIYCSSTMIAFCLHFSHCTRHNINSHNMTHGADKGCLGSAIDQTTLFIHTSGAICICTLGRRCTSRVVLQMTATICLV
uniref:Uncharacterized protein n=1 Tax=Pyxicephalus adspersus TaxID=30357 RepID=A0AAV3AAF1_PYXAD|nr:TPA: hypothetical protein GDO54_013522 [Pyxicephalus adspersus]